MEMLDMSKTFLKPEVRGHFTRLRTSGWLLSFPTRTCGRCRASFVQDHTQLFDIWPRTEPRAGFFFFWIWPPMFRHESAHTDE